MAINDDVNFGADAALEKPVDADMVPLFEKPLTPSDVGKLNRLVIPKQHAEKHFPLLHNNHSRGGGAASAAETVTLLTFEDDAGRCWRFRYSYWSSSQSYVLTKGWSRYVKENHLEAGDVVTFVRHRVDPWRLFIGCRRGAQVLVRCPTHPYPSHRGDGPSLPYQTSADSVTHAGPSDTNYQVQSGGTRRLRLFGVNLDCEQLDESPPSPADASAFLNHHFPAYSF